MNSRELRHVSTYRNALTVFMLTRFCTNYLVNTMSTNSFFPNCLQQKFDLWNISAIQWVIWYMATRKFYPAKSTHYTVIVWYMYNTVNKITNWVHYKKLFLVIYMYKLSLQCNNLFLACDSTSISYRFYSSATNATMGGACCSGLCSDILCCDHHHCRDYHSKEETVK